MGKFNKDTMFSSEDQTWETPIHLFNTLDNVFKFNLDVCAVKSTAKCARYFTPEIDGLSKKWKGTCWMNPPYGREQIRWINKAYNEHMDSMSNIVCLIPARPDTKIWQTTIFKHACCVCFIKGRLKFGKSKDSAPFPSALVIFSWDLNYDQIDTLINLGKVFINDRNKWVGINTTKKLFK